MAILVPYAQKIPWVMKHPSLVAWALILGMNMEVQIKVFLSASQCTDVDSVFSNTRSTPLIPILNTETVTCRWLPTRRTLKSRCHQVWSQMSMSCGCCFKMLESCLESPGEVLDGDNKDADRLNKWESANIQNFKRSLPFLCICIV